MVSCLLGSQCPAIMHTYWKQEGFLTCIQAVLTDSICSVQVRNKEKTQDAVQYCYLLWVFSQGWLGNSVDKTEQRTSEGLKLLKCFVFSHFINLVSQPNRRLLRLLRWLLSNYMHQPFKKEQVVEAWLNPVSSEFKELNRQYYDFFVFRLCRSCTPGANTCGRVSLFPLSHLLLVRFSLTSWNLI